MTANSDLIIYQENELYGLKDCNDNVIISQCIHSVVV